MKYILVVISIFCFLKTYSQKVSKEWQNVYQLEQEGNYKSAYQEVQKIAKKARRKNNANEKVKSFLYELKFQNQLEEVTDQQKLNRLTNAMAESKGIHQQLYRWLYIKELLSNYQQKNRYYSSQLVENTTEVVPDDIEQWTVEHYKKVLTEQANLLFKDDAFLKNTKIRDIKDLIDYDLIDDNLNETAFEFFAYNFINDYGTYFKQPRDVMKLNRFDAAFSHSKIIVPPNSNVHDFFSLFIAELYQKLENYYESKNDAYHLDKIKFYRYSNYYDYSTSLGLIDSLGNNLKTNFFKNRYKAEKARILVSLANKKEHKDNYNQALQLSNEIKKNRAENDKLEQVLDFEKNLKEPYFSFSLVTEVYENEPIKYLVSYRNIEKLNFAYFKIANDITVVNDSIYKTIIANEQPVTKFSASLPQGEKYFGYSTETLGKTMPLGNYLLVAYENEEDLESPYSVKYHNFRVTNVMIFNKNVEDKKYTAFYIVHPQTGKPYQNVSVAVNAQRFTTDAEGKVIFEKNDEDETNRDYSVKVFLNNETYSKNFYRNWSDQYVSIDEGSVEVKTLFYTDRSIYRPGQEVQFKGILYQTNDGGNAVVKNKSIQLIIKDDNNDELENKIVTTNEMGSFSGSFKLPKNIATGDFYVQVETLDEYTNKEENAFWKDADFDDAEFSFKVEEYKRPTFTVELDEIKKNVFFDEEITLKGKAKSLAGGAIANAQVVLNINTKSFKYNKFYSKKDTISTNDLGEFTYKITIPSVTAKDTIAKENTDFNVYYHVEVKDTAGEVREAEQNFTISNYATRLSMSSAYTLNTANKLAVHINASTLNGEEKIVTGKIKVFKTLPPKQFFMLRPWEVPELYSIDEETFRALFPYETYTNTDSNFSEKELVYEGNYTTSKDKSFSLDITQWETGSYEFNYEIVDEKSQLPVTAQTNIQVTKANETLAPNQNFNVQTNEKSSAKELVLNIHSAYDEVDLYLEVFNTNAEIIHKKYTITKGSQLLRIPLALNDMNSRIAYQWYFTKNHLMFSDQGFYNVPSKEETHQEKWTTEWEVWNNKLIPGNEYQWKLKILSKEGKLPMNGEFLASMYDASLDLLHKDYWDTDTDYFYKNAYVSFGRIFSNRQVYVNNREDKPYFYAPQSYYMNTLNYFGYYDDYMLTGYENDALKKSFDKKSKYYQIEVRDAITNQFITNAFVYNIKSAENKRSNAQGFSAVFGEEKTLIAVAALGYEQKRLQLTSEFTVVLLQPTEEEITQEVLGNFDNEQFELYRLTKIYNRLKTKTLFSKEDEIKFSEAIITKDQEVMKYDDLMELEDIEASEADASLDEIVVDTYRTTSKDASAVAAATVSSKTIEGRPNANVIQILQGQVPGLNISTDEGQSGSSATIILRGLGSINDSTKPLVVLDGVPVTESQLSILQSDIYDIVVLKNAEAVAIYGNRGKNGVVVITTKKAQLEAEHLDIPLRKNLSETAFFFPHLKIQKNGSVEINFKAPEALTEWKFRGLAHNEKAELNYSELVTRTQKDVMIHPNMPRFVRETDEVVLKARVSNTTNKPLQATAVLRLFNTITGEDVTQNVLKSNMLVKTALVGFSANTVSWKIVVPKNIEGLQYRISVKSGNFTDGEENVLPVLTNKELITETLPIWQLGNQNKEYTLHNLLNNTSKTLQQHQFVVEVSHNAQGLMLQILPYLFDYQYSCNEQIFAKYFADVLALHVLKTDESVANLVKEWQKNPQSKLEQNEELKNLLLQETPWMKDLISDDEKKAQWAAYFDVSRLEKEADEIIKTLGERQNISGGFGWFSGGYENQYITQHILTTAAQLDKLGIPHFKANDVKNMINKAHRFLDIKMQEQLKNRQSFYNTEVIDYAFVKSYYADAFAIPKDVSQEMEKNFTNLKQNWVHLSLYSKAKLALVVFRKGDVSWAKQILKQLNESAVIDETYGMYWKENDSKSYYYYNAAEIQALIIEAFKEIDSNNEQLQKLNAWLLGQKLNKDWGTTKATTSAIYAMLLSNSDKSTKTDKAMIEVGKQKINTTKTQENETNDLLGYQTYQWKSAEITNDFGAISIKNKSIKPLFGGIYWQYFEDLSAIKESQQGILNISKKYYSVTNDEKLREITENSNLKLGDKIVIRLEINAQKDMEFVHIKDVRAATFEPVDVMSSYQYKNGLRYYQSTKDAATHFFIDYLKKGSYVIDYEVRLNNEGVFTSGISTIQSMYAPEHSAHSNAKSIKVHDLNN